MKRSAKFNEKAMKKKLLTQTRSGAPVSGLYKCSKLACGLHAYLLCKVDLRFAKILSFINSFLPYL